MTFLQKLAAAAWTIALTAAPTLAAGPTPVGTWQTVTGESRYSVFLCGDGTQLCAKLTWLRDDARTDKNLPYLNTYVLKGAEETQANKWQGTVTYDGKAINGSVTLTGADRMKLQGCVGIFCKSLQFERV
ncbi:MAG TPA: DUF2147 domain-containing protein [Devosiaceae bacterium]